MLIFTLIKKNITISNNNNHLPPHKKVLLKKKKIQVNINSYINKIDTYIAYTYS